MLKSIKDSQAKKAAAEKKRFDETETCKFRTCNK